MNNNLLNIILAALCFLVLIALITLIVAFVAIRQLQRFLSSDVAQLNQKFQQLRTANPTLTTEGVIQLIIRQQAVKCGLVGALTGLGGFVTLPIALPIDILWSMRIQAVLVQFIATVYHSGDSNPTEQKLQTYLVMSGSIEVSQATTNLIMRFILRFLSESLSIFVPALGTVIGFGVNYAIAQATGNVALRWYSTQQHKLLGS